MTKTQPSQPPQKRTVNPDQLLVDALIEQRNRAQNEAAQALARSVQFQLEIVGLRNELALVNEELAKAKAQLEESTKDKEAPDAGPNN